MSRLRAAASLVIAVLLSAPLLGLPQAAQAQTKLLRFPDIHDDTLVFCYAGDLWIASTAGGDARRLTTHPGQELFPKFSPDGRWIAFTGQYDGDEQVYAIPTAGGVPRQLTWYPARGPLPPRWGSDHQVYGWTKDGASVLFRSLRGGWDLSDSRLYTVSLEGGLPVALPMPVSGAGELSPDGTQVVYSPLFRDFRTWKRYQGGWAADLYIFDLDDYDAVQITDHPRTDRDPMWIGDTIYFASDRDGTLDLYSYDPAAGATSQLTRYDVWDVRWPSADETGRIVFELGGELRIYDTASKTVSEVSIRVPTDGLAMRPSRVSAEDDVESAQLSPKAKRALVVARGDVFTVPVEKGPTRNLTHSSTAHDKHARWSPDGARIAFVSDMSGEEEIYLVAQDGSEDPEALTTNGAETGMRYAPEWSPHGKHIASSDKEGRLWLIDVERKRGRVIADEAQGSLNDFSWSPHGGHIALGMSEPNGFSSLWIYTLADDELRRVTGPMFSEFGPTWDPEGDYLFYLSDRGFAPQIGSIEWNYVVDRESGIYALALRKDVEHPFPPESDEAEVDGDDEDGDEGDDSGDDDKGDEGEDEDDEESAAGKDKDKEDEEPITIDFEGLAERVARVPVEMDNYYGLSAVEGNLLVVRGGPFYYGRGNDTGNDLKIFSMEDRKLEDVVTGIGGYVLSRDGKKVGVRKDGGFHLFEVKKEGGEKKAVSLGNMYCQRSPVDEWNTMFWEVWRRFRDFFYVENMHGYDWEKIGERYAGWLEHVAHRSDLNYVIGEMIAELNVSHAYISGGDFEIPDRPRVALAGCRFELDERSGRYRIASIYGGQNEENRYRSPLTEIGVDVSQGDYVLAIDGEELRAPDNPYRLLVHKADRPVVLSVNDRPSTDGAREVEFRPITNEQPLRYLSWVESRRTMVDEATDGRVGYLHVPDMGSSGIREFIKYFYGQIRKEGLVIDVRGNGGGNVSQMLIERLRREMLRVRFVRTFENPLTYPSVVFNGHLVCLLNETSASDGDIFPAMFRKAGLGPLIGKRSWGGVIGITGHGPLLDGGDVRVPQFGTNDLDGSWIIEGYGVAPDIEVENDPRSVIAGRDPQLQRAIEEVLQSMEQDPKGFPDRPAAPVRTPAAARTE